MKRVDTAPAAEGRIHVLSLQHAVAEELAQTLTRMLSGTAAAQAGGGRAARAAAAAPAAPAGGGTDGLFEGAVRVTADKATNSLVVTSSTRDYAQLRLVIDHLDRERRQVFIEAVIMDLAVGRRNTLGLSYHGGAPVALFGGEESLIFGGFNPVETIAGPTQLQALALGVRGPDLQGTEGRIPSLPPGISIPAFGVALNAIAISQDSDVLSTPHIIAMDNTEAEINVGENIPLQTNQGGGSLASLAPLLGGAAGGQGVQGLGALGALGALGGAPRQDVGTRIKITPHINNNNQVRLEIEEEISEQGATSGDLGAVFITQRSARTTVVVDDQQTVVIGGLMRDTKLISHEKVPLLGDLPVLGFLFRKSITENRKTNSAPDFSTPYVIQSQDDFAQGLHAEDAGATRTSTAISCSTPSGSRRAITRARTGWWRKFARRSQRWRKSASSSRACRAMPRPTSRQSRSTCQWMWGRRPEERRRPRPRRQRARRRPPLGAVDAAIEEPTGIETASKAAPRAEVPLVINTVARSVAGVPASAGGPTVERVE